MNEKRKETPLSLCGSLPLLERAAKFYSEITPQQSGLVTPVYH